MLFLFLVREFYQKIVHDGLKIGIHLIQVLCLMIFIGVYMFHHVVMPFMHLVGQSELHEETIL
jgi:amino acid permease